MSPSPQPPPLSSSILFENATRTIVVVDLPRSIEEAQELETDTASLGGASTAQPKPRRRRLLSAAPLAEPFPSPPEPGGRSGTVSGSYDPSTQLIELTTKATLESALDKLRQAGFRGPWCLPRRLCGAAAEPSGDKHVGKEAVFAAAMPHPSGKLPHELGGVSVPPGARYLAGSIEACREQFIAEAPSFDLIVLDPPWPNRSAKRRRAGRKRTKRYDEQIVGGTDSGYATSPDMHAARELLEQIPVGGKLADNTGTVAVWVTNKPACETLLTDPKHGLFRTWGVELVATWTWLKVTTAGEPVVSMNSHWRKPWERLLLARRPGVRAYGGNFSSSGSHTPLLPANRVIFGVPDVHSRKPNLRPLIAPFLRCRDGTGQTDGGNCGITGLEVFARNLTAGWWAWGDEVLLFQHNFWWAVED